MHLTGLHLLLTYCCTSECDHCFVYSSPQAPGTMSLRMAKDAVKQAAGLSSVREIWIEGGEPFMYYPILLEIVGYAHACGLDTGIVTNAYFAETVDDALTWLVPLQAAGLTKLSISNDTFHSETYPYAPDVEHLVEGARRLELDAGTIYVEQPGATANTNAKGEPITGGSIRFRGRAVETLAEKHTAERPWQTLNECPDEDWDDVGRLHLDAYGNLFSCQGIVFGNLNDRPLAQIVRQYRPQSHPIIGPLHHGGPAELVRKFKLPLDGNFLDACHLCYAARQLLREQHPQYLAPAQVYGINNS